MEDQDRDDKIQKELTKQSYLYSVIVDAVSDGMLSVDMDGIITFINPAGMRILGIDKSVIGKHITEGVDFEPTILHVLKTHKGYVDREFRLESKRGIIHFVKTAIPLKDENGKMIGVLDIFRNINDVKSMVNRMTGAHAKYILSNITGESDGMQEVKKMIKLSGLNDSSILIQGEVGTGKKIIAQAIHNSSIRKEGPFVVMNCATFPRNLIESELFGYEEGSFTARNKGGRPGKLEMANGGTLLLEEIGDMPVEIQSKLLRVLQKKSVIRVGGFREIPVDIRLIAASSKNLIDMIRHNNFLEDLYFMINVTEIQVPPLREREGDIDLIADQMINQHNLVNGSNKTISDQARVLLHSWYWPGNVRELEKTIEYSFYLTERNEILPEHLRGKIMNQAKLEEENSLMTLKQAEAIVIKNALEYSSGNVTKAAKILDIGRNTLYEKMRKYGLNSLDSKIKMTNM